MNKRTGHKDINTFVPSHVFIMLLFPLLNPLINSHEDTVPGVGFLLQLIKTGVVLRSEATFP